MNGTKLNLSRKEESTYVSVLAIDAMYYNAAKRCYLEAKSSVKKIDNAFDIYKKSKSEINRIEKKYEDKKKKKDDGYHEVEQIYISLEGAEQKIEESHGPFIQQILLTHILCITALEAHINTKADEFLTGKDKDHFYDLSLESKWMFLPKMLKSKGYDYGSEPFQSFSKLIKLRNKLIHYKPKNENWQFIEGNLPFEDLGISLEQAEKSLLIVKNMIIKLADFLKFLLPYWVEEHFESFSPKEATHFFKFKIVKDRKEF